MVWRRLDLLLCQLCQHLRPACGGMRAAEVEHPWEAAGLGARSRCNRRESWHQSRPVAGMSRASLPSGIAHAGNLRTVGCNFRVVTLIVCFEAKVGQWLLSRIEQSGHLPTEAALKTWGFHGPVCTSC